MVTMCDGYGCTRPSTHAVFSGPPYIVNFQGWANPFLFALATQSFYLTLVAGYYHSIPTHGVQSQPVSTKLETRTNPAHNINFQHY